MIYANESHIEEVGIDWSELVDVVEESVMCLNDGDFAQPVKPYLRYRDKANRIIAMPAFIGGKFNKAGIKWISSFPGNIKQGIPRAHSVIVLNDVDTGKPEAFFNTPLLSIIRTAAVSGLVAKKFLAQRKKEKIKVGIVGFGPIGINHYKLFSKMFGDIIDAIYIYDSNGITDKSKHFTDNKPVLVDSWQEAYRDSDIFITCTVSERPYIDEKPKAGSLLLNVSLRDYTGSVLEHVKSSIIVDDWDEVCRENTDIQRFHLDFGLEKNQTYSISDVVCNNLFDELTDNRPVMFNPMGMAIFDVSVATYYLEKLINTRRGVYLDN